ncbi:hypothetical protein [Nocardia gamkensis]|uniref:Uncharacterized protein n=1 Tax=Nocardia gamkensis TaxID=352869 RepID=A0A7X6L385_9NOCA|nr:hypothetical protein [Nocardia gamkensis]NKY26970.1 hypothetical protein [Nocardia gamkensis]NQE68415.1 hypothetical protein [Nocardia gamkensis]
MKPLERPVVLALVYSFCSVLFGPAIYLGGYLLLTQGLMDYCDSTANAAEFDAAQGFQIAGAGTMLGVGCVLLIDLWAHRRRLCRIRFALSSFGILVMMFGFVLLILVSGPSGQVCSPG